MKDKAKEKRQFLYFDYMRNKELTRSYYSDIDVLNDIICELETNIVRAKLTLEQKTALCADAQFFIEGVKLEIRGEYKFPTARERWNLEALGIQYEKLDYLFSQLKSYNNPCDIDNEGNLIESKAHIEKIKEQCEVYTNNELQSEVLNNLTRIVDATNELRNKYLDRVFSSNAHFIGNQFNSLIRLVNGKYEVDAQKISLL